MKKILLSVSILIGLGASAQNGDLSGNLASESGKGFTYSFNTTLVDSGWNASVANCIEKVNIYNSQGVTQKIDTFQVDDIDSTRNGYLSFMLNNVGSGAFISNKFPSKVCGNATIDLSSNKVIRARVKTTIDTLNFSLLGASEHALNYVLHDATFDYQTIYASGGWSEFEFIISDTVYNGTGDLAKSLGYAISIGDHSGNGDISFDWIVFGDAIAIPNSTNQLTVDAFTVYPNPANDVLNVKFNANQASTIQLIDLTGKVVSTQNVQAGLVNTSFGVAGVNAGIYFVNVKNTNGLSTQKVVIK